MGSMLKVSENIHFGLITLKIMQIIQFQCLNFFQIKF